jgi:hypothetical protein
MATSDPPAPTGTVQLTGNCDSFPCTGAITFLPGSSCSLAEVNSTTSECSAKVIGSQAGEYYIEGAYSGDSNYPGGYVTVEVDVKGLTTTAVTCVPVTTFDAGGTITCGASVTGFLSSVQGETVTFSQPSGTGDTGSISFPSGNACTLDSQSECKNVVVEGSGAGSVTLMASYPGDTDNSASSGTTSLTVNADPTVTVSPAGPLDYQVATGTTLTADVVYSGSYPLTIVWYKSSTLQPCSTDWTSAGAGGQHFSFMSSPGTTYYCAVVSDSGVPGYASGSNVVEVTVSAPVSTTTTTVVVDEGPGSFIAGSSPPSAFVGDSFHDAATVDPTAAAPTGSVTYHLYSGGTCNPLDEITGLNSIAWPQTVTLSSGSVPDSQSTGAIATFGQYSFQAVYSGDSLNEGSTSACEPFTVEPYAPTAAPLTVSSTATQSFTRTYSWGIAKSVTPTTQDIPLGGSATFSYTVTVSVAGHTDSAWQVTGTITVTNPNTFEATGVTVADTIDNGGSCTVIGGAGATIPASGSSTFDYTCAFSSNPGSGTNTATATWSTQDALTGGTASGTAVYTFGSPTTIVDGSVTVTDTLGGTLGTVSYTDSSPKTFTYLYMFSGDPAGTCTSHSNTASFTMSDTGTTGSSSQSVAVCVGADLTVSKTAQTSFTRTMTWGITKYCFTGAGYQAVSCTIDQSATSLDEPYEVSVDVTGYTDSGWEATGTMTVTNPNNWESISFTLADSIDNGGSCSITGGAGPYTLAASTTATYSYVCTYSSAPSPSSGTNTATATVTAGITPDSTSSGTAPYDFGSATITYKDTTVTINDPIYSGFPVTPRPCNSVGCGTTIGYSHTYSGLTAGTCTTFPNTATFTTSDTHATGSSSASVTVCVGADLTVSKTAFTSFTRTFTWGISKTCTFPDDAPNPNCELDTSATSASVTYTVTVTHNAGTDSHWLVSGTITVTNPNTWEAITANVGDTVDNNGVCQVSGGTGVSVPAGGSVELPYTCTYSSAPSPLSGTNTATATWDSSAYYTPTGSASGTAAYAFTTPTSIVDGSVSVTDSNVGDLGTASATGAACTADTAEADVACTDFSGYTTFVYSDTAGTSPGSCVEMTNTATFTANTDGATRTTPTVTATLCIGEDLTVSKTANTSFTRTYTFGISKSVDQTEIDIVAGGTATFTYTVSVKHDAGTDSGWLVSGTITVTNPNTWEAITANVADSIDNGGGCTVTGGTNVVVPKAVDPFTPSSVSLPYTCTYSSAPSPLSGTNTATATWDSSAYYTPTGSASGTAAYAFTTPTSIVDGSAAVTDTLGGTLGTASATGASCAVDLSQPATTTCSDSPSGTKFTYSLSFSGVGGTSTSYTNKATFTTDTTGTTGSASQTVAVNVGEDLKVSKTATTSFARTYTWAITKSVTPTTQDISLGGSATFPYTVKVTNTGYADSGWEVTGTITVTNPNNWEAITATVVDSLPGGACTVNGGSNIVSVPASSTVSLPYVCTFASNPGSGTNTATAAWNKATFFTPDGSASGTAAFVFGAPTTIKDDSVTVTDSLKGSLGSCSISTSPCTFTYSLSFSGVGGTGTSYANTVTFKTDTTGTTGSASQTAKVYVGEDLTVSETASPAFTRTFAWTLAKYCNSPADTLTTCSQTVLPGGAAMFNYGVITTNTGYANSAWAITGTITVTNPNNWEAITLASISDAVNNGGTCTSPSGTTMTVPASSSITFTYSCTFTSGSSGTSTATASWTGGYTPHSGASSAASFAFATPTFIVNGAVKVTDPQYSTTSALGYCYATGVTGTPGTPCTFTYSHTFTTTSATQGSTSYSNTATMTGSTQATLGGGAGPTFNGVVLGTASSTVSVNVPVTSTVTNGQFCSFGSQFPLIYTGSSKSAVYKLSADYPGEFYDNVFVKAAPGTSFTLTINVPFPFVTQGARPIQTSSSYFTTWGGCFVPSFNNPDTSISTSGGHLSPSRYPVILLNDYGSNGNLGSTQTITVKVVVPSTGVLYITVQLAYGLNGQSFNELTSGTSTTGIACTATSPCAQWTSRTSVIIGSRQPYAFNSPITIASVNVFYNDPGS